MRRWWQLATRNWWASPGRAAAAVVSVALGVATVVVITSFYETARRAITSEVVSRWLGSAHLSVQPAGAHWGRLEADLAGPIAELDNVRHVTARLRRRMIICPPEVADQLVAFSTRYVDAIGILPLDELHFRSFPGLAGRMIAPNERGVAVLERKTAGDLELGLGDDVLLGIEGARPANFFTVVGLFDGARIGEFQKPQVFIALADVWAVSGEPGAVSAIDVMLEDASPAALAAAKEAVEKTIAARRLPYPYKVESAEGRQMILDEAERITRLLLTLTAFVALLTSFFIILTTMSMSLFQRRSLLGVMRCVGMTRSQLAWLIFVELVPLGLVGTLLGIGLGIAVARGAPGWAGHGYIQVQVSEWGLGLSAASGIVTTLVSGLLLVFQVCRVQPLTAVHTEAQPPRSAYPFLAGAVGIALLITHECFVSAEDQTRWLSTMFAGAGAGSLYLGYILLAPSLVVLVGPLIARLVGPLMGIRASLAVDQFGKSPWRSTGVCWVLMVGLSLIVYIGIGSEVLNAIWDFPGKLPEAFVWSRNYVPGDAVEGVRKLPGVADVTVAVDVECEIKTPDSEGETAAKSMIGRFLRKLTRPVFVACDPQRLLGMIKVTFMEGSAADALGKLARGGFVLIPSQAAHYHGLHLGDRVDVTIKGKSAQFEIAGVIQSPALDLAVTGFQATSYLQFAAASALLGTREDLEDKFGLDVVSMFMLDLDLPQTSPPADFDPSRAHEYVEDRVVAETVLRWADRLPSEGPLRKRIGPQLEAWLASEGDARLPGDLREELRRYANAMSWVQWRCDRRTPEENWERFRERLVLQSVAGEIGRPDAVTGSLRRLKRAVERSVRQATIAITWIPSIALVVAAIGIGNLMMVSVHIRARQIAVLRAVGALKSQIVRLVLAEAIALGVLGSVMGVALGLHEAYSDNRITAGMIGFHPEFIIPYGTVALGVAVTVVVCLLAGLAPARYAARNNIIDAMQTT